MAYEDAPWYKFDDETVTRVKKEDAIDGNYGGQAMQTKTYWTGAAARVSTTSAYMCQCT